MPAMGLNEPESDDERRAIEASIPADAVMVTGSQGSGTRLMCRVLQAGGFAAWHDSRHGLVRRPVERVVVMVRERRATLASIEQNFVEADRINPNVSLDNAHAFYPAAAWVNYDHLCALPGGVMAELANWLGVDPWPLPEPIVISANTRRYQP